MGERKMKEPETTPRIVDFGRFVKATVYMLVESAAPKDMSPDEVAAALAEEELMENVNGVISVVDVEIVRDRKIPVGPHGRLDAVNESRPGPRRGSA